MLIRYIDNKKLMWTFVLEMIIVLQVHSELQMKLYAV